MGEPETNGCAERWIRTLKEQCLWAELHDTIDELRQAVTSFVKTYNTQWLIGRLGHRTPKEAYQDAPRPQRHDQIDLGAVQPTGRCSRPAAGGRPLAGLELREEGAHEPVGGLCRVVWLLMIRRHHQMRSLAHSNLRTYHMYLSP